MPTPDKCAWLNLRSALKAFAFHEGGTESAKHIKPFHWYIACRLVIEGGFNPDDISPRPPFRIEGKNRLIYDPSVATHHEQTVLGGLKTKNVDVVVSKPGIGPVLAISCKGMTGAFRNLTNRLEETIGECTNLHITYPALVFGYVFLIRANRTGEKNDIAVQPDGDIVESIKRFHNALRELTGRRGIRNDISRYEAIALAYVMMDAGSEGLVMLDQPPKDSPLRLENLFSAMYLRYDERFVFSAPDIKKQTRRSEWHEDSPAFHEPVFHTCEHIARMSAEPPVVTRPFRIVPKTDARPFVNCLPLVSLEAAAGAFSATQDVETLEWVAPNGKTKPAKDCFIAQVHGQSMNRHIPDGAFCIFSKVKPGSRGGRIVLAQHHSISDPDNGGQYTVKRFRSTKAADSEAEWKHTRIWLEPDSDSDEFTTIEIEDPDETTIIAELIEVLTGKISD